MAITFEKVLVLKNISIFEDASEMALADLVSACEEKTYKAGEVIVDNKTSNRYLYIILSGSVRVMDGETVVHELSARQFFGETTVFSPAILPFESIAHEKTTVLRIGGNQLYQMMSLHPTLGKGFIGELSRRLRQEQMKNI
ncbi:MAG: Crp/Fnr family transcriptional regulator [Alphaproteobacteria bacterium]|nr:Crp/Fnr family transcriptional regulator [Alphaproteobacteria bacterium]